MALEDIVNQIGQQAATPVMPQLASATPAPATTVPSAPAPGSVDDLEQRAHANIFADLQNRAAAINPPPQPGQLSPGNPFAPMVADYSARVKQSAPDTTPRRGIKGLLTNFLQGSGESMMHEAGLVTPTQQRQQDLENFERINQLASAWESQQQELTYRQALLGQLDDNRRFQSQQQPLTLQHQQLENQSLANTVQQQQNTIHPSMTAGDLQSLGLSQNLSGQFAGKPLSSADMQSLFQLSGRSGYKPYDYGKDGTGQGSGIWLVDAGYNPIRQLSPVSESARSNSLAKFQQQLQLQTGTAGQQGIDIVEGRLDPSQISPRSQNYGMILNAANQYSQQKYGQPFDFAKAAGDFKYANNPSTKNTLNYLNALVGPDGKTGNLQELINQSDAIGRTPFPALNDVAAWARLEAGSPKIAAYHAQVTETADMVAKILQGGGSGTSDAKMRQAQELFQNGFNASQIRAVAGTLQGLLQNRKGSLIGNNSYLQKWYAQGGNGSPQPTPGTAVSPSGSFDWNSAPVVKP
jgi:hypothetical protein